MSAVRRLLTIGHSYALGVNRRLAHSIEEAGGGRWEVVVAAPKYFHGRRDLRPAVLDAGGRESDAVQALDAHLTGQVHLFFYGTRLRSLLREGWDLVHMWEEPFVNAGFQVSTSMPAGVPLVFMTMQNHDKRYPAPFRWMESSVLRRSSGWISCGQLVADTLRGRPGYSAKPMALVPLGVDVKAFRPDPAARAAVRRALAWDVEGPPVIGFLGRFVPEKGPLMLMSVLDRLRTPWRALFVGGGPLEVALRGFNARHRQRVRVCTNVEHADVPRYLNAMDVLAAPSQTTPQWREQFGRIVVEAFACGVPVVGSDSGEIPHVVGDAGQLVAEADVDAWVAALSKLLENPRLQVRLAARGLERAAQFSWSAVGSRYVDFFDGLLSP